MELIADYRPATRRVEMNLHHFKSGGDRIGKASGARLGAPAFLHGRSLLVGNKNSASGEICKALQFPSSVALHLLHLQGMNITICEIGKEQSRLRREIMERRCVLAALDIMHEHVASGEVVPASTLGDLILNLAPVRQPRDLKEVTESVAAPEPAALPSPPLPSPEEYYVHPELKALGGHGSDTSRVRWAISQMTRDYSLQHLAALLKREGIRLSSAKISVVLSRLKKCGEIEEIRSGAGPIPTLFRRPNIPRPADFKPLDEDLELPPEPYRALRQLISTNPRFERLTPQTSLSDS